MMEGVADGLRDRRFGRDARELLLELSFERQHERLAPFLAHSRLHGLSDEEIADDPTTRPASYRRLVAGNRRGWHKHSCNLSGLHERGVICG
jgi:hypothetical protein